MHTKQTSTDTTISLFDRIFRFFIAVLPWSVFLAVFLQFKLGVPGAGLFKEIILMILGGTLVYEYWKNRELPKCGLLEKLVGAYIGWLMLITLVNHHGLAYLVYGGRYDFEFLIALLIAKHGVPFLKGSIAQYVRIFLWSGSLALFAGILVRFVVGETFLLHFGFSPDLSNWSFGGSIPIYHGIDGANVRRFQGIFDGPNPAAYFILVYMGILVHFVRTKKDYHFLVGLWILVLIGLMLLTYSRSSIIGLVAGIFVLFALSIRTILKHYKKNFIVILVILAFLSGAFYLKYENTFDKILLRDGSSKGHFDRAITGLKRFREHPMGQGLAEAGPAYRYIKKPTEEIYEGDTKKMEDYYIPESWYIQQLEEGGIIGGVLFAAILLTLIVSLAPISAPFLAAFIGVLTMNLFLHTFESVYISLILFSFIGLFLGKKKK